MPLFGRAASDDLEGVLRALLSDVAEMRALARNLMHDHRVQGPRETSLRKLFKAPLTRNVLEDAVKSYRDTYVRYTETPDFIDDEVNGPNILAGTALGTHEVSKDLELGRVLNLSGMRDFYASARERVKAFATVPDGDPMHIKKWVDVHMEDEDAARRFVSAVLKNLWPNPGTAPIEPCWVTTWDALEEVADEPASRWAEIVGLAACPGDWLILLRYRVRDVGTLVRPTQLDAGWNALHFPSPPTTPLTGGGHPMDLGISGCAATLHAEFIHQQIPHELRHWDATGRGAKKVGDDEVLVDRDLAFQRQRHWELLCHRDGPVITAWMPDPM